MSIKISQYLLRIKATRSSIEQDGSRQLLSGAFPNRFCQINH
jgi:hypothetical protein